MKQAANNDASHAPKAVEPVRPRPAPVRAPGGRLAQLAALANGSARVQPLAQLKDDIQQSPRVQNLMDLAADIHQGAPAQSSGEPVNHDAGLAREAGVTEENTPIAQRQPAQLYTSAGGKKISAKANYYVKDADNEKLFVKSGATLGDRGGQIVATGATETYNSATYSAYHYYADDSGGFVNDCLDLAEKLALSAKVATGRAELRAPGSGGADGKLFGQSYKQNTNIAQNPTWSKDEEANPAIGEAYAIAPTVVPGEGSVDEAPYHVAAVVAKDTPDNITLEADAGAARSRPLFDIYDTQPSATRVDTDSKTFHEVYASGFTYSRLADAPGKGKKRKKVPTPYGPSTGVLTPRTD
jgi:hypothetical protein